VVRGRYAPSPTGDLHLGNARTALVAWLAARSATGRFVLRVEDLDPPRVVPGAEARILDDLRWMGLDWDEGPDVGGPHVPYRQSERGGAYRAALEQLHASGRLYACSCSRAQLRGLLSAPHGPEGPPYPGLCRDKGLPVDLDRGPALRFRLESGEQVAFDDRVLGRVVQDVSTEVGDFVVRRSDGLYTYQLAVTVDDAAMEITQIVRGADLASSTPRQIALQRALGYPEPEYGHVPLVVTAEGERLAKRDRPVALGALRAAGVSPERVVGVLAHSLGLLPSRELATPAGLVNAFAWDRIPRATWVAPTEL
jgi:glutamyl-tRNA synthetase